MDLLDVHKVNLKVTKSERHTHKRPLSRRQRLLSVFFSSLLITILLFLIVFVVFNTGQEQPVIVAHQFGEQNTREDSDSIDQNDPEPTAVPSPSAAQSDSPLILQLDPDEPTPTPPLPVNIDNEPQIVAHKQNFTADEIPQFELDYFIKQDGNTVASSSYLESTSIIELPGYRISAEVLDATGDKTSLLPLLTLLPDGHFYMALQSTNTFVPGAYQMLVKVNETGYAEFELRQDFTWGVFALNTAQDSYLPGDDVDLHMTVLDDQGATICDATIDLSITSPGGQEFKFSTSDDTISKSTECAPSNVTYVPDFAATLQDLAEIGSYQITALVNNGKSTREFTSSFSVRTDQQFVISRNSATRIYPLSSYKMEITIHSNENFVGTAHEYLPASFEILGDTSIDVYNNYQVLSFPIAIAAGGTTTFSYEYDAPDISPEFYLAGPVEIKNSAAEKVFQEHRSWQIASDAVGAAIAIRLWTSGFERNTTTTAQEYTSNIGTTPTISTSTIRSGTYALRTNLGSAGTSGMRSTLATADSATGTTARAYIRVATLPSTEIQVLALMDGTNYQASIRLDGSGNLKLWDEEDNAQIGSTLTSAVSTNTWYRLELQYDFGTAATGDTRIAGAIDGNIFASSSTQNHANGIRGVDAGILASATGDFYWDDIAVNQDGFVGQNNWVGEGKVVILLPDGNGSSTSWAAGTNAFDYLEVDDPPSSGFDDITTYVQCAATSNVDDYTLASTASAGIGAEDRIRLVEGWSRARSSTSTGSAHAITLYDGTNTDAGGSNSIASTTWFTNDDTIPRNSSVVVYNDLGSANHSPITPSDVDGYQIRLSTGDCTPAHQVSAVWAQIEYVPKEGGRVWSSGFELNSGSTTKEWDSTAGTVSIDSTTKRSGAYSLRANSLASSTEESVTFTFVAANSDGPYYVRTYLYLTTAPSADNRIIELQDSGNTARAYIELTSTGTLELYDEDGIVGSASSALNTGQWYRVEMQFNSSGAGSTDTIEARIDGSNFATSSTRNLTNGVTKLILGGNLNGEAQTQGDWYFDDVAINNGIGVVQTGYPGSGKIVHLHPNADGDETAWSNTWQEINEVDPDDSTTDSISTSTNSNAESAAYEDSSTVGIPSDAPITLVSAGLRTHLSAAATSSFVVTMKDVSGGQKIETTNIVVTTTTWLTNAIAVPKLYPITAYSRPMRDAAWSISALDSLQIGVRENLDSTSSIRVATMWALVEYDPAPITIEGTCDAYDQTTDCGDTGEIKFAVNGSIKAQTQATVAGTWTISGVEAPANGDVITVFIDGASDSDEAVAVTKYDGSSSITGIKLFKEHLTIGSADNQTITNANLAQYDNSVSGDEDIFFDVSAGNDLTVDSTSQSTQEELYIVSGNTYQPASAGGGDVATHDIEIDGTITADSNAFTVSGSWDNDATFTAGTSLVTMTATSGTETIDSTGASVASFNDLTLGTSGTATWNLSSTLDVNDDIAIAFGTLGSNGNNITVGGDWTNDATFSEGTATVTLDGANAANLDSGCADVATCTNENFYNLILNKDAAGTAVTLTSTGIRLSNLLTLTQGTLTQGALNVRSEGSSAVSVAANGIWSNTSTGDLILGGSFANAGAVTLQGTSATCGETDAISITSTSGGSQRSWTGSGSFSMNDVSVQDQGGSASITVYSGTSVSGNDTNWTFSDCPAEPALYVTQSSGQLQVDAPNHYRMIMNTGDTSDYMTWYDRDEDDVSPDATHEFQGPCVTETNVYCLRDDANRKTTILETTLTRIRIVVEGKLNNEASTDYLDDESATPLDILVKEEYTFTIDGVTVATTTDFRTTGVTMDADSAHNGYEWLGVSADVTDGAFDDGATPDIIYGDGETQTSANQADGAEFANTNTYVFMPGTGSATYQDAFIGILYAGWYDDNTSSTVHEWNWDEGFSGTQDMIAAQEQAYLTKGVHKSEWTFQLKAESKLDTEAEREGFINDIRNGDFLTYTTGSTWDDNSTAMTSLLFDASNDLVNAGDPADGVLDFDDTADFTVEAWINWSSSANNGTIIDKKQNATSNAIGYNLFLWAFGSDANLCLYVADGTDTFETCTTTFTYEAGKWMHVAAVFDQDDDTATTTFTNGIADEGSTLGTIANIGTIANGNNFQIGRTAAASSPFGGMIDEVRVWNDVRTAAEIKDNMHKRVDPTSANLVGYWRMDEATGQIVHDLTSNDNDGTLGDTSAATTDDPTWIAGIVPDHFNKAESAYTVSASSNNFNFDIDAGTNISTLLNGAFTARGATLTVDSTTSFAASGNAFVEADKFSYTGTTATTFTGLPATGELDLLTHADNTVAASMNRHSPVFKIKNWRSLTAPGSISLEGSGLAVGTDYTLDLKPVSHAVFAQDIVFYAPLQTATVSIGTDITTSGCTFDLTGKYGRGLLCDADSDDATFTSTSNIDYTKGALEFWLNPISGSGDNLERNYFNQLSGSDQFRLRKTTGNDLEFLIHDGTNSSTESVTSSNYAWEADDWVHIRLEWDDSAAAADAQKIFINGVEPTHTDGSTDWVGSNVSPGTTFFLGNSAAAGTVECNCILDEFYIYDLNGSGDRAETKKLAEGGDTADADEYLYDSTSNYTLDFNDDDANNRGEYIYIGSDSPFEGVNVDLSTVGAGSSLDFDWEYWTEFGWSALTVSDTTSGASQFTADGNFYFTAPGNWVPYGYNANPDQFYIRGHLEGGTYSTDPVESTAKTDIILFRYLSTLTAADQTFATASNTAPNSPTSLSQKKTDDTVIVVADWTSETSVKFTASASDTDNPDTLYLCIEADQLGTAFSNTEDSCGSGVAYSGSPVTVSHTLTSLTQGAEYHWQARVKDTAGAYSAWVSFSTNTESDRDFGIDNTAPATGTVYDGIVMASDADLNDGDLTKLYGNWSGITDTQSKIEKYQYAIGTTAGATDILTWTDKTESGSIFSDAFEGGSLAAWNSSVTDSGDLAASSAAQYTGLYGAKATIDDTTAIYVQDDFTAAGDYYARVYLNPNSLTMTSGDTFTVMEVRSSTTTRASLELNYDGANYRVRGVLAVGPANTSWVTISGSAWSSLELRWFANASGFVSLWVDGVQYDTATGNTSSTTVDNIRVGATTGLDAGTSGNFNFDTFTSGVAYLGPLNYVNQTISASGHLHTGQLYFFSVRGVNNAGTTGTAANSDGLAVLPTLAFSVDDTSVDFVNLTSGNSWTDTQSNVLTTSTNAYNGYVTYLWNSQNLTNTLYPSATIPNFAGTNATPITWTGTGFGYTTSDSALSGGTADRFTNGGPKYAGFALSGAGDPVADHTTQVTGTTGAINSEQFTITYRITSDAVQAAGPYTTNIIYIVVPIF